MKIKEENKASLVMIGMMICLFISPAYADWFDTGKVQDNLVRPLYSMINDALPYGLFIGGVVGAYIRGSGDLLQKSIAFAIGAIVAGGSMKVIPALLNIT